MSIVLCIRSLLCQLLAYGPRQSALLALKGELPPLKLSQAMFPPTGGLNQFFVLLSTGKPTHIPTNTPIPLMLPGTCAPLAPGMVLLALSMSSTIVHALREPRPGRRLFLCQTMALMSTRLSQPAGSLPSQCTTVKALTRHQIALTVYFARPTKPSKRWGLHLEKPNVHPKSRIYLHLHHRREFPHSTNILNPCRCPRAFKNIQDGEGRFRLQLHLNDHRQTDDHLWSKSPKERSTTSLAIPLPKQRSVPRDGPCRKT